MKRATTSSFKKAAYNSESLSPHEAKGMTPAKLFFSLLMALIWMTPTRAFSANYYWVGGTGNWSDISHWATTSGGGINHFVVPTANDDVFFDANSFTGTGQVVTVTDGGGKANVVCRSMNWTGAQHNPTLAGNSTQTLRIYGSLTFIAAMTNSFQGKVYFESLALGNTVTSAGQIFQNDVVFQGTGGWTLGDSLTTTQRIEFKSGSLITDGKTVRCRIFISTEINNRILNIAHSTIIIEDNNHETHWDVNGTNLQLYSLLSTIFIKVTSGNYSTFNHSGAPNQYYNLRYQYGYNVNCNGGSSRFNNIYVGDSIGNASYYFNLNSLRFADSVLIFCNYQASNCTFDSVIYLQTAGDLLLNNNNSPSYAATIRAGGNITINNQNKIDSLWVQGNATINRNNEILCDSIFGDASINGSYYDQWNGGWQTSQKNNFGHLVVMGNSTFTGINQTEHCVLNGNATFSNFNTFDSLYLAQGKMYQFGAGDVTTITDVVQLEGSCTGSIILQSTVAGTQTSISKASGIVAGNYLSLRDINATGGATFNANNSVDLGNNSGWNITTAAPLDLYWVGGTGNWDDPAHWSFTSGGTGGACLPTAYDNVFFDANSFNGSGQVVTLNIGNAVCNNLNCTGSLYNPTFAGASTNALRIYGSLTFIAAMTNSFQGKVYFESLALGNSVTSAGQTFKNDVVFQGTGGWTLGDSLTTTQRIEFKSGSLITDGKTVRCRIFISTEINNRILNIAHSTIIIEDNNHETHWDVNGTNLQLYSLLSTIFIKVTSGNYSTFNHSGAPNQYYNLRYQYGYNVNCNGGSSRFNNIYVGDSIGNASYYFNLNSLRFADSVLIFCNYQASNCTFDSVIYLQTAGDLLLNNNNSPSYAATIRAGGNITINTQNKIDSLWVQGNATINRNNEILCDSIFGDASINGSYYDQWNGGWQTSQKNNFGHLVVMGNSTFTGINQAEHCVLHGNATFSNFNTFDSLYLAQGKMYQFGAGDVTTITDVVQLEGSCTGSIILQSTVAGTQTSISKASGIVAGNYLSLRDINATGGATFNANNSVDLGNNSGWNITTAAPLDLYWVGGTGNWDDPAHWSFTSGGTGGACLPTAYDNVFFDANSFNGSGQVVTLNIGNAVCNNLNCTGSLYNPTFAGASTNALRIYGSLTFIAAMTNSFQGKVYFESLALGNSVTSAGQTFKNDVVFQGTGGWTLGDSLTTTQRIEFKSGSLITDGKTVRCRIFISTEINNRILNIAHSTIIIEDNNHETHWDVNGTNLQLYSLLSTIFIKVTSGNYSTFNHSGAPNQYYNLRYQYGYNVNCNGGSSRFNNIYVGDSIGNASYYFNLNSLRFADSVLIFCNYQASNCTFDSVIYLQTAGDLLLNNNNSPSYAATIRAGGNITINTQNKIDSLWVQGNATINRNNEILCDSIFGDASINGSYYDQWNGGWQTSQKNNFGHLVVMGNSTFTGINQAEHCVLHGNATFSNFNTFDSLYLASGKMYSITGADSLKVASDLLIRGNNCFPIQLRSTTQGQQATLWKPVGEVSGDFLELRDINAAGGATFFAGSYSTDLGNNTGWQFNNSPGYVYGLGPDTSLCIGQTLSTINFNGAYSYLWQDGSTLPYYTITQPGEYWVIATYATNCSYRDTINVDVKPTPVAGISGANPWICTGGEVQLQGQVTGGVEPYHFSWWPSPGLSDTAIINPVASPETTTSYVFQAIGANDCPSTDTVLVQVAPPVEVNIVSTSPTGCGSTNGSASATASGGRPFVIGQPYQYLWNTVPPQTTTSIAGLIAGSYQVEATDSLGCTGMATVVLNDPGAPVVGLAVNTDTLCQSESLTATASGADLYEFFVDGISQGVAASNPTIVVGGLLPGTHTLAATGTTSGCSGSSPTETVVVLNGVDALVEISTTVSGSVCPGEPVTFITTTINGGTNPQYQWFVNGGEASGETASTFTAVFQDQDVVKCRLTSNAPCVNNAEVWSNELSVSVVGNLAVSVSIAASPGNTICTGQSVVFTANAINGGTDPGYMWFLNNTQVAFGSNSYTLNNPANGDEIYCVVTSNLTCSTGSPATSNAITLTVNSPVAVSISIATSATTICEGESVTFTASPVNGGTEPHFQWLVNGANGGTDDPAFAYEPANGDIVSCQLTSNAACSAGSPATSNAITLTVNPPVAVNISITASATTICEGETVTFTASPVNGGTEPHFQWLVNGTNAGTDDLSFAYEPMNGDVVTCQLTSNAACSIGSPAISNAITLTVNPPVAVNISITASATTICEGETVTFTASPVNGGTEPHFQWLVNGTNAGTDDLSFAYEPMNGDVVTCQLTSNAACSIGSPAISNAITLTVNPPLAVSISLTASATTICEGETVTFTASPVNGGTEPHFQWLVNGTNAGTDDLSFAYEPTNGDIVSCQLTSNAACSIGSPATSNAITLTVNPPVTVSISIATSATIICEGESVTFTASPVNGGTEPHFQWLVNGTNAGTDDLSFAYEPMNGDVVTCQLTSNAACSIGSPAISNAITLTVNPPLAVSISLTASATTICEGETVTFTASPVNGGTEPHFQWLVNGTNAGTDDLSFAYEPTNGDIVSCQLTSNAACSIGSPATSNAITLTVNPPVTVSISIAASATTICEGESVTFTASPVNGGTEPHFQWLVNGTNAGTDDLSFAYEPMNGDVVTCQLTSNAACSIGSPAISNAITLTVNPPVAASITLTASATTICEGETVTFTASPVNGGTEPHFQWLVNGTNAGTDDLSFAYEPTNGDIVSCQLTSNAACSTGSPATSNGIAITTIPALELTVTITASAQKVCIGTGVELTALTQNGGPAMSYQWKLNGIDVGTSQPLFTFIPADDDEVVCVVTNQPTPCLLGNPATSNTIVIRVGTPPPPKLIKHD